MAKKKICLIDEDGRYGGPQKRMIVATNEIDKSNYDIEFLIPVNDTLIFEEILQDNKLKYTKKNITRLSLEPKFFFKYFLFFFYEILIIKKFLKKEKFQIVQINSTSQFKGLIAGLLLNLKIIWVIEDTYMPLPVVLVFKLLASLSKCHIIYTSDRVYEFYLKNNHFNKKTKIYAPVKIEQDDNKKINNTNQINILTISGYVPVKGLECFIEICNHLKLNKNYDFKFTICGSKISSQIAYYEKIQKLINISNLKIEQLGFRKNINKLLKECDIFLCTSLSEAGPMTLFEAMAMGKPVVTSDVGASRELIEKKYHGYIIPINDSLKFAEKILELLNNKNKMMQFALDNYARANQLVCSKEVAKKYCKIYESF